jgi:hypothetical protein
MGTLVFALVLILGGLVGSSQLHAASCVNGVYRAGCAGPNGAAVVHKGTTYRAPPPRPIYRQGGAVNCVNGVYRAGCVGPNGGGAVIRKPY